MRLESLIVRNYRVHRECRVDFDAARTLIGGPNESGKSTLIEAAHRGLFLKAKTGGEVQKSMISRTHGGHPEVEIAFTARGASWRVLKKFSGVSGTVTLIEIGGSSWSGGEAEEKLSALLGAEAIGGNVNKLREQWAHLWIWQGCASDDPTAHANTHCRDLLSRLQQEGGAAAVQSEADQRVAQAIAERHAETFRDGGKARAGSPLACTLAEEEEARAACEQAQSSLARLEKAAGDFAAAEQSIHAAASALAQLGPQRQELTEKLSRVARLRGEEALQTPAAVTVAEKDHAAANADAQIRGLRAEIDAKADALKPAEAETAALESAEQERRRADAEADGRSQEAAGAVRASRLQVDLAAAQAQLFERSAAREVLEKRREKVRALRQDLAALQASLAQIPAITPAKLAAWQKLERELEQAAAARDAMATGVEVLGTDLPVRIGARELTVGDAEVLTEETLLEIGPGVRLRIRPGGGRSLAEARQRVLDATEKLRRELDTAGLPTLAEAANAVARRQQLDGEIKATTALLEASGAETIEEDCAAAEQACAALAAEVERRLTLVEAPSIPETFEAARGRVEETTRRLGDAERAELTATTDRQAAAKHLREATQRLDAQRQSFQTRKQELENLGAQLRLLIEMHGDDATRSRRLGELARERTTAQAALAATRAALAELQPELLERDRQRLDRAIEQNTRTQRDAQVQCATARGELQRDGSTDPHADLALADERLRRVVAQREHEQQRAGAIALLHELFREEQKALADQFTRPLAARISRYLECLFGAGAKAEVTLADGSFTGLRLTRAAHGEAAYAFDHLSGGAREQLAAAVRLALAEVLAETHDGCLPVVFDDAFAYSDPQRVQTLQRMLDVAAERGLQIIVLSCNPADYAALGAKQVLLRTEPAPRGVSAPPEDSSESTAVPPPAPNGIALPVTEAQRTELLFRLHALGGSSGNYALRDDLGWSAEIYDAVKNDLVSRNALRPGRGKGGSVALAENADG